MKISYSRITAVTALFLLLVTAAPSPAAAQWNIGAAYEIRNEAPENGFGVRLERELLQKVPLLNLRLRGHFSYFSEDNYAGEDGVTYGEIESYDYGLAAVAAVSVGLLAPYVGTGLGSATTDLRGSADPSGDTGSESDIYWNGFVGAEISPVPVVKPFVEYRYQAAESFNGLRDSATRSNERLIFGLSISF